MSLGFGDVVDAAKERTSDPFLGSFCVTFAITNWRFFYVLAASNDTPKAAILEAVATCAPWWWWCLLAPLLAASFFTFVWPWVHVRIVAWRRRAHVAKNNAIQKADLQDAEITVATLQTHPRYVDKDKQGNDLWDVLRETWSALHPHLIPNVGAPSAVAILDLDEPPDGWDLPVLLAKNQKTGRWRRVTTLPRGEDLYCGFRVIGARRMLAAPNNGLVPFDLQGTSWLLLRDDGARVPYAGNRPGGPVLARVSGSSSWSVFYSQ